MEAKPVLYFDFVSPFSYLLWENLKKRELLETFEYKPIILAKVFNHWGQKFIADIIPKRDFLFKKCLRYAKANQIKLLAPTQHPFNSLYALRMASSVATQKEDKIEVIDSLWKVCWQEQLNPGDPEVLVQALEEKKLPGQMIYERSFDKEAKKEIKENINEAIEKGVFGVPTMSYQEEIFWGNDSLDEFLDFFHGKDQLDRKLFQEIKRSIDSHGNQQ